MQLVAIGTIKRLLLYTRTVASGTLRKLIGTMNNAAAAAHS